jgi:hypothetical protein
VDPDIGYSSVHERYMAFAAPFLEGDAELQAIFAPMERLWGRWLEYNLLKQPGAPLVAPTRCPRPRAARSVHPARITFRF